ncbi:hypothetical protein GEMRC1_003044 [Eukaryota sp. GEM-RC1]
MVTKTHAVTPKYAASEQFDDSPGPFSDIYSLGLVMYEILSGKEAFEGYSVNQIIGAKFRDKPLHFDSSVPDCLKDLISKCLNSDPMIRPTISEITEIIKNVNVSDCDDNEAVVAPNLQLSDEISSLKSQVTDLKKENVDLLQSNDQNIVNLNSQFTNKENSLNETISLLTHQNNVLKEKVHDAENQLTNYKSCIQSTVKSLSVPSNTPVFDLQSTTALGFQLINSLSPTPQAKEAVLSHLSLEIEDSSLGRICTSWLKLAYILYCPEELASENLITSKQGVLDTIKFFLKDPTPHRLRVIGALCDHFDPELLLQSNLFELVSDPSVIGDVAPLIFQKLFEKLKSDSAHTQLLPFIEATSPILDLIFLIYIYSESFPWFLASLSQSFVSSLPKLGLQLPTLSEVLAKLGKASQLTLITLYSKLFSILVADLIDQNQPIPIEVLIFSLDQSVRTKSHLIGVKTFLIRLLLSRGTEGEAMEALSCLIKDSDGTTSQKQELLAPLNLNDDDFNGLANDTDYKNNPAIIEEVQRLQSGAIDLSKITGHKVSAILISKNMNIPESNFKHIFNVFDNSLACLLPVGEILNSDSCQAFTTASIEAAYIPFNFPNSCFSRIDLNMNKSFLHIYYCLTCGYSAVVSNCGSSGVHAFGRGSDVWLGSSEHKCPKCSAVNWSTCNSSCEVPFKHFSSNPQWQPGLQPGCYDVFVIIHLEPCMKGLFRYSNRRSWLLGSSIFLYMVLARACVTNSIADQYARMYDVEHGLAQLRDTLVECLDVLAIVLRVTRPQVSLIIAHVIRKISHKFPNFVCTTIEQKRQTEARIMGILDSIELDPLPKSDLTAFTLSSGIKGVSIEELGCDVAALSSLVASSPIVYEIPDKSSPFLNNVDISKSNSFMSVAEHLPKFLKLVKFVRGKTVSMFKHKAIVCESKSILTDRHSSKLLTMLVIVIT